MKYNSLMNNAMDWLTYEPLACYVFGRGCFDLARLYQIAHLRVKSFWGESDSAVRIQNHAAIITFCLIGITEHDLKLGRPVMLSMRIHGSSLLTKDDIMESLPRPQTETNPMMGSL